MRECASKYIQEGKYQAVRIDLDTIIKISPTVDIVGGVGLHLIHLTDSLLYIIWQRALLSMTLPRHTEMHARLHVLHARPKSLRSPLRGVAKMKIYK